MSRPDSADAASREMLRNLREAAEARELSDAPRSFVPDAAGGDPIPWCDNQRETPDAPEQRRH